MLVYRVITYATENKYKPGFGRQLTAWLFVKNTITFS